MQTPQTIAILGIQGIGGGIAGGLVNGCDRILLSDEDIEKARKMVSVLRAAHPGCHVESVDCAFNGAWEADIIVLNAPGRAWGDLAERIRAVANQKVMIIVGAAEYSAAAHFPDSRIVEAFSSICPADFTRPPEERASTRCPISGKDGEAVLTVERLVRTIGFQPMIME